MASSQRTPAGVKFNKTKEEALEACAELHNTLVSCYKTCGLGSTFTGCCTAEHKAFWECYTQERGTNQTRITSWLDGIFGGSGSQQSSEPQAQQQQAQQQRR